MTRASPRIHFHSSTLIRCLADLALVDTVGQGNAFAEKLGTWIHFTDAITLHAVHGESSAATLQARPAAPGRAGIEAGNELARVQALLADAIVTSCTAGAGRSAMPFPAPSAASLPEAPEAPPDLAAAYVPYRRFYEAQQRGMEAAIQPLRSRIRAALARQSPALAKLAELDATFDKILRERESKLLAKLPLLLRKRFDQLFNEHRQQPGDARPADAWLAQFRRDMQTLLLAELELRLQPALGLIEACNHPTQ